MSRKTPKFFCEFCGTEVKRSDKFCPSCGKFFAAVKCPSCGMTGQAPVFAKGCPSCGYAVFSSPGNDNEVAKKESGVKSRFSGFADFFRNKNHRHKSSDSDPLPLWIYFVISILLAALIIGILIFPS